MEEVHSLQLKVSLWRECYTLEKESKDLPS